MTHKVQKVVSNVLDQLSRMMICLKDTVRRERKSSWKNLNLSKKMLYVLSIARIHMMPVLSGRNISEADSVVVPQKMRTKMHKSRKVQEC